MLLSFINLYGFMLKIEFKLKVFTFIKYSIFDNQSNNKIQE
jgi:hypothetical protein